MARSDAFFAKLGRRPDISTISDRFFDENSIDFFDRLLDDRRLLDDTFIVLARMRDVEKNLVKPRQGAQNPGSAMFG